ncbi:hypothetical protein pqer_cds_191 [Pandoravirus quercus]|uniref:Uncharacterized protein n=2 Tax=Pandoravirus TaxID=2060084 RepID=A0A2U7U858_9VIRU|nr:hypothetical protein pqer_cds_191 [Pandoravirus quercus]AVK74613.1 hypothetical protein pqer_cds_191 [Pandoravirus quercus]QBZ80792.1 hypothetical protein pclt_cds_194 [Pandoravirus celtis]
MAAPQITRAEFNAADTRLNAILAEAMAPPMSEQEEEDEYEEQYGEEDYEEEGEEEAESEDYFFQRVRSLDTQLNRKEAEFTSRVRRRMSELNRAGTSAIEALGRVAAMAQNSGVTERDLAQVINRDVVPTLKRIAEASAYAEGLDREVLGAGGADRRTSRIYGMLCNEIDEIAKEFQTNVSVDPDKVVQRFLGGGPFQVQQPFVGIVTVDPRMFAAGDGRAWLVESVQQKINAIKLITGLSDTQASALDGLRQRCSEHPAQIAQSVRNEVASAIQVIRLQAGQMVPALIDALGQRGIRAAGAGGEALRALTQALADAFGVEVAVEVSEPQIDLDPYYAQLYEACNHPYGIDRARVAHLAEIVGVPSEVIAGLDARGICQAALQNDF